MRWLALAAAVLLMGCVRETTEVEIGFLADKPVYHSQEILNLGLNVTSNQAENLTIRVRGLNGRIDIDMPFLVDEGLNMLFFEHTLPRCNVCGGISPGGYDIIAEVIHTGGTANRTVTIEIQQ